LLRIMLTPFVVESSMFGGGRASVVGLRRALSHTPRAVARSDDRLDCGAVGGHGLPTRTYV
jgi:hypothetical protein